MRASSTRSLYDGGYLKTCAVFYKTNGIRGKAFSKVKVYLVAIAVCFMSYASRLSPVFKHLVPTQDLATDLDALFHPPFEPLGPVDLKVLSRLSCC